MLHLRRPDDPLKKKRALKLLTGIAVAISVGLLYYLFIRLTGFAIPCPVNAVTGLLCPGCGVSRMAMAILRLDLTAAFAFNPALFCSLPLLCICFGAYAVHYVKTGEKKLFLWQNVIIWLVIAALLAFCVYRNADMLI